MYKKQWKTLEHSGPLYPGKYIPSNVKLLKYNRQLVALSPLAEHCAVLFASVPDKYKDNVFKHNFWSSWKPVLGKSCVKCLEQCDFSQLKMQPKFQHVSKERIGLHKTCKINSVPTDVANYMMEPMCIFKGRGDHPLRGTIKMLVPPSGVTLNLSRAAAVPRAPDGKCWGNVVHKNDANWLAVYKDTLGNLKYMYPVTNSSSEKCKYDNARQLSHILPSVRRRYNLLLKSTLRYEQQLGCALWLIDNLCLRVGNEKRDLCSDTVGACTLRVEHLKLLSCSKAVLCFNGKDSIEFKKTFMCTPRIHALLSEMIQRKHNGSQLFEKIDASCMNTYLQTLMPGLTAKVFRTCHASKTFQNLLQSYSKASKHATPVEHYKSCNESVAELCNHKRGTLLSTVTSRTNYIDPRITYAFCRTHNIPVNTVFSSALQTLHSWAQNTPASFVF